MSDSQSFNPYAASQIDEISPTRLIDPDQMSGVWRDGRLLVVSLGAQLPWRCIKCNVSQVRPPKRQKLTWHSPWLYLGLLAGLWPYIILAMIFQKQAKVELCLCHEHARRRRNVIVWGWIVFLLALVTLIFVLSATVHPRDSFEGAAIIGGAILLGLSAVIISMVKSRLLTPHRIEKEMGWFTGCCPEFLESLPAAPAWYQPRS